MAGIAKESCAFLIESAVSEENAVSEAKIGWIPLTFY
jgi:hypothetical protein